MKKVLKGVGIGCLAIIGLFTVVGIFGLLSEEKDSDYFDPDKISTTGVDSAELSRLKLEKDSLAEIAEQRKEEAKRKLGNFRSKTDEFEGTTFYTDKRAPFYTNVNFVYPYIGEKNGNYWLRFRMQYTSSKWLFINKAIFLVDGAKFELTGRWERDNDTRIWEWSDIQAGSRELLLLNAIANSKSAKVRYIGSQYRDDRTITSKEKSVIKRTIDVYTALSSD
jgi:hypothetical protein